jgi:exodeoxyribonuclease-3
VKVATWNINGINSRLQHVLDWCAANDPDVLCLQELKCIDSRFPAQKLRAAGFPYAEFHGEKSYNGVAILSKHRVYGLRKNFLDDQDDAPRRLIGGTINGLRLVNVYAPHGTALGSDKMAYKLNWFERLRNYFDTAFSVDDHVLLVGDLNVAPHEMDVWKPSLWKDKTHFSKPERDSIRDLKRWGFVDVFRQINEGEKAFTWWSNFHNDFEKDRGLRIDFIWASPPLAETCVDCFVDKEPRAWEHPSDHAPVVAEFRI